MTYSGILWDTKVQPSQDLDMLETPFLMHFYKSHTFNLSNTFEVLKPKHVLAEENVPTQTLEGDFRDFL